MFNFLAKISNILYTMYLIIGYLLALKDIFLQNDIEKYRKIDLIKFEKEILFIQDKATKLATSECEQYGPSSTYLTSLSKEK
jgi:hypothetical protein